MEGWVCMTGSPNSHRRKDESNERHDCDRYSNARSHSFLADVSPSYIIILVTTRIPILRQLMIRLESPLPRAVGEGDLQRRRVQESVNRRARYWLLAVIPARELLNDNTVTLHIEHDAIRDPISRRTRFASAPRRSAWHRQPVHFCVAHRGWPCCSHLEGSSGANSIHQISLCRHWF